MTDRAPRELAADAESPGHHPHRSSLSPRPPSQVPPPADGRERPARPSTCGGSTTGAAAAAAAAAGSLPVDPDVEPQDRVAPLRLAHLLRPLHEVVVDRWDVLVVISLGGAVGSLARWGTSAAWPTTDAAVPWATVGVNVLGSALLGLLMVLVRRRGSVGRYVRPFLGVGVLGGYTTFSTYALDVHGLVLAHRPELAGLYLVGSVLGGLLAVWVGVAAGRALLTVAPVKGA